MSTTWNTGDRVLAWWSNEALWYPGTVKGMDGENYVVGYDDGTSAPLPADHLRPLVIETGQRLQANWLGAGTWYSGVVERKDGDKLAIKYADGDEETIEVSKVRLAGSVPPSVRSSLVWTNGEAGDGETTLVRLTPEWLTLAPVPTADLAATARAAAEGGTVSGQILALSSLVRVEGAEDESDLIITANELGKTTKTTVHFATPGARAGFLGAFLEQAGIGWSRRGARSTHRLGAMLVWLFVTALVGGATWLFYSEACLIAAGEKPLLSEERGSGRKRLFAVVTHWVEGLLGPIGVLIVGGIALAFCAFVWVGIIAYPSAHVVYEREKGT